MTWCRGSTRTTTAARRITACSSRNERAQVRWSMMRRSKWVAAAAVAAIFITPLRVSVQAQNNGPVMIVLDKDAIAAGQAPNSFAPTDINATIAAVGVRDVLPVFTP